MTPAAAGAPILIVDDNSAKRLALKSVLSPLGYRVVEASSGMAALRCVMAEDFAVILLDVCMPVMSGFETAALIRQRRQSEMTPIIFVTAFRSDEVLKADRYAEGAVDFIFSPVPPGELRAKVAVFASLFVRAEALAAAALVVQASADRLRHLMDAAPVGIFHTDPSGRYVYTNPRWSEITGVPSTAALGQEWDCIVQPVQRVGLTMRAPEAEAEWTRRFELSTPGRAARTVVVASRMIPEADGGTSGWVGTLTEDRSGGPCCAGAHGSHISREGQSA